MQVYFLCLIDMKKTHQQVNTSENKTYGLNLRNDAEWSLFKFQLNVDYEKRHTYVNKSFYPYISPTQLYTYQDEIEENTFSISGIVSAYLNDSTIIPSVFYKRYGLNRTSSINNNAEDFSSYGWGYDLIFKLRSNLGLYVGSSVFGGHLKSELGAKYNNDFLNVDFKYFYNDFDYSAYMGIVFYEPYQYGKLYGVGANLRNKFLEITS